MGPAYNVPVLLEREGDRQGSPWAVGPTLDAPLDRVVAINPGPTAAQWLDAYKNLLSPLPPGVYQLIVHLAYDDDEMRGATSDHPNWGAAWRQSDLDLVKSQAFRDFLKDQKFVLVSWKDISRGRTSSSR
jgi:hypothetical protein